MTATSTGPVPTALPQLPSATRVLELRAHDYVRHPYHRGERIWTETNCYVDVWLEVLNALGCEPLAAAAFAISSDFDGDQWSFFKYPPEDLRAAFGIEVAEMNAWRPLLDHLREQALLGRLMTIEADSWYLPDTHGVAYGTIHQKSTIVPNDIDVQARRLGYFHNAGYFELAGDDFDGVFRLGGHADPTAMPPYVELVRLDNLIRRPAAELTDCALELLGMHVSRLPARNPVQLMAQRITADLDWLRAEDGEFFHQYAFGTCRQCGASAEFAAEFLTWLAGREVAGASGLAEAGSHFRALAESTKSLQFSLARAARGRNTDLSGLFAEMTRHWQSAASTLTSTSGR